MAVPNQYAPQVPNAHQVSKAQQRTEHEIANCLALNIC
jgi:hypothetical protein